MVNARRFITDGFIILIGQGLSRGLGVLLLPILTLVFLPAQFGMSALATSYVSFVSVIALLGLDLTYLQSIPGIAKPEANDIERVIWTLTLSLAICAAIIGSVAWWLWGKQTPESTPWLALGIFSTMIFSVCQSQMKVARQYLRMASALSVGGIVMYAWVLVRGFSGHNQAVTLVSGYTMGALSAVLVSRPTVHFLTFSELPKMSKQWQLVRIGLPAAFSAPVFWILSSMDRWLVAQFWGVSEAGIYSVAASISGIGLLFGAVVQTIWLTEASWLHNARGEESKTILAERVKEICFLFALAWLAFVAFSGEIVHLFAKPPYDRSLIYLPWLMTSVMLYGLFQALSVYLIITKTLNKSMLIWGSGGVLFIALSLLTSKTAGPVGIAASQSLVYAFMLAWMFFLVRHDARLDIKLGNSLFLMLAILLVGIVMVVTQDLHFEFSSFLLRFTAFAIVSALVVWHFKAQIHAIFSGLKVHE